MAGSCCDCVAASVGEMVGGGRVVMRCEGVCVTLRGSPQARPVFGKFRPWWLSGVSRDSFLL
jgi:hypothetical protein